MGFTGPYRPHYELLGFIVALLRADDEMNSLVFSVTPQISTEDKRIYSAYVDLPPDQAIRAAFPRVTVETTGDPKQYNQTDPLRPQSGATIFTYVTVPKLRSQLGEQIDARILRILSSTPVNSLRIIGSELVPVGQTRRMREPALDDAWRYISQFRADLVGVL